VLCYYATAVCHGPTLISSSPVLSVFGTGRRLSSRQYFLTRVQARRTDIAVARRPIFKICILYNKNCVQNIGE
jgi:hypothetical protein